MLTRSFLAAARRRGVDAFRSASTKDFASAAAAEAVHREASTVDAPELTANAMNELSSDSRTRRGYQPFNLGDAAVANKESAFDRWSFDDAGVGMIVPDFHRPNTEKLLNLEECILDCEKLSGRADGLNSLFGIVDGKPVLDTNNKLAEELKERLSEAYTKWGVVLVRNTNLVDSKGRGDAVKLEKVTELLFTDGPEAYTAGSNLRGQVDTESNVYDTGAPRSAHLHYHHEMQYVNRSPKNISFLALAVPRSPSTGPTYVSYNPGVTRDLLATATGQKLAEKGACYVRKMPDLEHFRGTNMDPRIVYNFWQTSMNTEDPADAQAVAETAGLDVEWEDSPIFGRYMVTRFYIDAYVTLFCFRVVCTLFFLLRFSHCSALPCCFAVSNTIQTLSRKTNCSFLSRMIGCGSTHGLD